MKARAVSTQIAALSVELGRLGERYKEGHPEVQKVKAQVEQLKRPPGYDGVAILRIADLPVAAGDLVQHGQYGVAQMPP